MLPSTVTESRRTIVDPHRANRDLETKETIDEVHQPLWKIERDAIETAIAACGGSIPKAAALLEVSPSTIYRKRDSWLAEERLD